MGQNRALSVQNVLEKSTLLPEVVVVAHRYAISMRSPPRGLYFCFQKSSFFLNPIFGIRVLSKNATVVFIEKVSFCLKSPRFLQKTSSFLEHLHFTN